MARRPKNQITPPPELNYKEDIKIDPDALDVEWLDQAQTFCSWAEEAADASARVDRAKDKLKVVKAEVALDVRLDPAKYGFEKITDKMAEALVDSHDDVKAAASELVAFKHGSDIAIVAVKAFEQRKTALENLVKLHGQQYFAGPTSPRNLPEEYGKAARHRVVAEGVSESLNRDRGGSKQ